MPYKTLAPGRRHTSEAVPAKSFKIRNQTDQSGKFKIQVGEKAARTIAILKGKKDEFKCADAKVVLDNVGACDLEWQRS